MMQRMAIGRGLFVEGEAAQGGGERHHTLLGDSNQKAIHGPALVVPGVAFEFADIKL